MECTKSCWGRILRQIFPFLSILQGYSYLYDLPCDLLAGLTIGIMHIPQGMAYALLAQLPPQYGLYTSFYAPILYFLFGTSRHISMGTFAVISLMVGAVVDKGHLAHERLEIEQALRDLTNTSSRDVNTTLASVTTAPPVILPDLLGVKVGYAMSVTFVVGILQLLMGMVRLGFLTSFLSDPLISGFTTGAAVHVLSSQVKYALGVKVGRYSGPLKLIYYYRDVAVNLPSMNYVALVASFTCMLTLVLIKEGVNNNKSCKSWLKVPIPVELIVIIIATIVSHHIKLHEEFGVEIVGHIPNGLPPVDVKVLGYVPDVIGEAFAICVTAYAISFALAKILADRHDYTVDPNQELMAYGVCNVVGGLVSSFCSAGSLSRSMVQDAVGGRTQVAGLVSASLVLIVLLSMGALFRELPNCILAAIIIVSLKKLLLQFRELKALWRVSKVDLSVWVTVFCCTVLLDVDLGLLVGFIYNLIPILLRTQRPYVCLLGHLPGTTAYADMSLYKEAEEVPGVKIFRFESPLYFANVENFRKLLIETTQLDPKVIYERKLQLKEGDLTLRHHEVCLATGTDWSEDPCEGHTHTHTLTGAHYVGGEAFAIVVDASTIQYVDSVTTRVLKQIILEYKKAEIDVYLGECKASVRVMLDKSGFYKQVDRRHVCATLHHAVECARRNFTQSFETLAQEPEVTEVSTEVTSPLLSDQTPLTGDVM